jgi:excisionase family DNA binding protein
VRTKIKSEEEGVKTITDSQAMTMSVPEAGRLLGLSRNAAYEAARRREIPVLRFGRKLRVPRMALERLLRGGDRWRGEE